MTTHKISLNFKIWPFDEVRSTSRSLYWCKDIGADVFTLYWLLHLTCQIYGGTDRWTDRQLTSGHPKECSVWYLTSPQLISVENWFLRKCNRQTDRQTDEQTDYLMLMRSWWTHLKMRLSLMNIYVSLIIKEMKEEMVYCGLTRK